MPCFLVDLDRLKQLNDTHGHLAGDQALARVAELISAQMTLRQLAGRWGGDEFTVLCPDTDLAEATRIAERLVEAVAAGQPSTSGGFALSITVGLAHLPSQARDRDQLYTLADEALYGAKQSGRGRVGVAR